MQLALADNCRARWTNLIHDEWIRNVLKQRPDLIPADLARTRELMNSHARDALVTGFEYLIPTIDMPDVNDRHVVAAAVHAEARTETYCCLAVRMEMFSLSRYWKAQKEKGRYRFRYLPLIWRPHGDSNPGTHRERVMS